MLGITAPMLLIQGDVDRTVDYQSGALADFDNAKNSNRYLLTFRLGGHDIGLSPAPAQMRSSLWDIDWFQDPVWRADRANAINLHFITAFLAVNLKHDTSMNSFLDVPVEVEIPFGEGLPGRVVVLRELDQVVEIYGAVVVCVAGQDEEIEADRRWG